MEPKLGTVRISPQVLATIARLTAVSVPGVAHMYRDLTSGMQRFVRGRSAGEGVRISVQDDAVSVDLHIVAAANVSLHAVGVEIQAQVARAIKDMVGMPVLAVNVHFEDVASAKAPASAGSGKAAGAAS